MTMIAPVKPVSNFKSQFSAPLTGSEPLCCYYVNRTELTQILRITNIPGYFLERVLLPGQPLMFEACRSALLEIHSSEMAGAIASDTIPCQQLQLSYEVVSSLLSCPA